MLVTSLLDTVSALEEFWLRPSIEWGKESLRPYFSETERMGMRREGITGNKKNIKVVRKGYAEKEIPE